LEQPPFDCASTSVKTGKLLGETMTGVEDLVILRRGFQGDARQGENVIPTSGLWASASFFNIFSFPLIRGDRKTALEEPYSIVLTEEAARKLFGDTEPLGKTLSVDTVEYAVTGVMADIPKFSHMQFDALVSFSTKEIQEKDNKNFLKWESIWMNYVYVLLPEGGNTDVLQQNLDKLSAAENAALPHRSVRLWLQPLYEIALGKDLSNQIGPTMTISVVWVVGGLAFVVILSACFNYTNLSLARAMRRSKEVGIRKVIGAQKGHVLGQFVSEAVIISLMALVLSFLLFLLLRPYFLSVSPELTNIVVLDLSPRVIAAFLLLAVVVGLAAGILPAIFFSRINASRVLKDASSVRAFRNLNFRKGLIVVQYVLSLTFIAATIIGYRQYRHFLAFDLGFKTENILNVDLKGNKSDVFLKEIAEMPEVTDVSRSLMITSVGNYWGSTMKYTDPADSSNVFYNTVDENYLPLHGHKLLAGRNFTPKDGEHVESEVIVNEQVLERFNISPKNPSAAVGEMVKVDGKPLEIVGVMKDFHYGQVDRDMRPVILRYANTGEQFLNLKIISSNIPATLDALEKAWKKADAVHPFEATFYDDQIEQSYNEYAAMLKIIGFLAFLAISIASLGLLGMVVFMTETRVREISIRKVLGASEGNLILLLSRGFLLLLVIAAMIALPATYVFFDKVVLSDIVYRAPIGIVEMLAGVGVVMVIAFIMIGSQTIKVARSNPAAVLKSE
ncbi:MAG TPA: ABC transporter permease, partial [Ohtaekwangia sp.]|nr:ABC transporter permease [Ohtaekwangia sp.]